jgi:hypothetical protein
VRGATLSFHLSQRRRPGRRGAERRPDVLGQHAPHLEAGRRTEVHRGVWIAILSVLLLALVAAIGVIVGLNLWGSTIAVPTGDELRATLLALRQTIGGGGFI